MRNADQSKQIAILIRHFGNPRYDYITRVTTALQERAPDKVRLYADTIDYQITPRVIRLRSPHRWHRGRDFIVRTASSPAAAAAWFWRASGSSARRRLGVWVAYAPVICDRPRVIHLTMSQRFGFLEPILQTYDTKLVVTFSGTDVLVLPFVDERWRAALSRIFERASYIHTVSEQLRNHLIDLGAPSEKTITIYRSVDPDHLPAEPQGCTTSDGISIASVGRLTWQKGQIYALHAIKLLVDKGFQIRYRIAGEGAERHHLSFWIKKYQLEHVVELLGEQPRAAVRSLLQQSDVFLHPSVSEGLPNAILEASAAGLPIISTQVGGIPEAVQHDITGLLVPPADPAALSQALAQLIEHPEQRLSMGKQGRAYMTDKFSRQREIDEWLALYQNLL